MAASAAREPGATQARCGMSADPGSEKRCSRCGEPALRLCGHQWLCAKHYRFGQMRSKAKQDGKTVPSHELLETLASAGMACGDCGVAMNWLAKEGQSTVASLQHYRDGTYGIVCRTCNTRHAFMPGDTYREMPKDHKLCAGCKCIKPLAEFTADNSRSGPMKVKSKCKTCSDLAVNTWKKKNRDQYNQYQQQYRARRKAEGRPVRRGA